MKAGVTALLLACVLAPIGWHLHTCSELADQVNRWKSTNTELEERITAAQTRLASAQADIPGMEVLLKELPQIQKAKRAALARKTTATQRLTALDKAEDEAVAAERERAVGHRLPSLTLASGKTYTDVQIKSVGMATVSLLHKEGAMRVTKADAPPAWVQRFMLVNPPPKPKVKPQMVEVTLPAPPTSSNSDASDGRVRATKEQIRAAQARLIIMQGQVRALYSEAYGYEQRAAMHSTNHSNAVSRGRISSHSALASNAAAGASMCRVQAERLQAQCDYLSWQLSNAVDRD